MNQPMDFGPALAEFSREISGLWLVACAEFMNRVDQDTDILRIGLRNDAMPEIEHMPGPCTKRLKHFGNFGSHRIGR